MQNKFNDMQTFVTVVKSKGIGSAAARMGQAKSGVSRRIKALEERLGTQLISRTTRNFRLTEAGSIYYQKCLDILEQIEQSEDLGKGNDVENPTGTVRLTGPMTLGTMHLVSMLTEFAIRYPRITLDLQLTDRHVNLVEEGFDLAVRITRLKDSTLLARQLTVIRHATCASPAYLKKFGTPKDIADLKRHVGLAYSNVEPSHHWLFRDPTTGETKAVDMPVTFRSNNGEAMRAFAVAGLGIVTLPTFIIYKELIAGALVEILHDEHRPLVGMHAVYPQVRYLPTKTRVLIDFLVEQCGEAEPYWDRELRAAGLLR